jgi:hypothetical protein
MKRACLISIVLTAMIGLSSAVVSCASSPTPTSSTPAAQPVSNSFDFEANLRQVEGYSISAEIEWYATGEKTLLTRDDPRYAEFIHLFNISINGEPLSRTSKDVDNDETPAISRTIPYAWGYILTFTLRDGSKVWFNCSSDNIWFETENDIYKSLFSQEFRLFLEETINIKEPDNALPGIVIEPVPGKYLYYDSQLSVGTLLNSVSVRQDVSQQEFYPLPNRTPSKVNKGDPILLVTGQIESQLAQDKYLTMYAKGYDSEAQEVSYVLDHGPIDGVISVFLPAKGFGGFIIHMNAAPEVVRIRLTPSDLLYDIPPP